MNNNDPKGIWGFIFVIFLLGFVFGLVTMDAIKEYRIQQIKETYK